MVLILNILDHQRFSILYHNKQHFIHFYKIMINNNLITNNSLNNKINKYMNLIDLTTHRPLKKLKKKYEILIIINIY